MKSMENEYEMITQPQKALMIKCPLFEKEFYTIIPCLNCHQRDKCKGEVVRSSE